jgi:hypothetical protein
MHVFECFSFLVHYDKEITNDRLYPSVILGFKGFTGY